MIFVGDIAIPHSKCIFVSNFPKCLYDINWVGNLEGCIVDNYLGDFTNSRGVFNDISAIKELIERFNFKGLALANNHIFDVVDIELTTSHLNELSIPNCGIGINLDDAVKPLTIHENGQKIVILNFGWEVIQCEVASKSKYGVNPLTKSHVLNTIQKTVLKHPTAKIIPYMHWSYELEAEPQPFERELAKKMIDLGAAGVIGSHPHRVGGFELYKNRPILYSLGNWLFKQNYYMDGQLSFPDFCNLELAFEWNLSSNDFKFHFFNYDRDKSELTYLRTENKESKTMRELTPFLGLSDKQYRIWYKNNHYHKNKGLPIYYWDDSDFTIMLKNRWNKTRDYLLKVLLHKGK